MAKTQKTLPAFNINKTNGGLVKVAVSEFKGKLYLNIRHYYKPRDSDEFLPTKKGVMLPLGLLKVLGIRLKKLAAEPECLEAIEAYEAERAEADKPAKSKKIPSKKPAAKATGRSSGKPRRPAAR